MAEKIYQVRWKKESRERERECMYSIPGVMEAPAAIYILSAISTSDVFN